MPKLRWLEHRQDGEKIMWTTDHGDYKCTITPPDPDWPLPMYHYQIAAGQWRGRGGASSLEQCQKAVAREIDEREAKILRSRKAPGHTDLMVSPEKM